MPSKRERAGGRAVVARAGALPKLDPLVMADAATTEAVADWWADLDELQAEIIGLASSGRLTSVAPLTALAARARELRDRSAELGVPGGDRLDDLATELTGQQP